MNTTQTAPEYLSKQELVKVLNNCDVRSRAMFALAYGHALRASEIADLKLSSVANGYILCVRGKKSVTTTEVLRVARWKGCESRKGKLRWHVTNDNDPDGSHKPHTSRLSLPSFIRVRRDRWYRSPGFILPAVSDVSKADWHRRGTT
jgi:integrase